MNKTLILYRTLARTMSITRPHGGAGVSTLSNWLIFNIADKLTVHIDEVGNIHVDKRDNANNSTLFVAHLDSVHHQDGSNKITKTRTAWMANGAPLGAEDGAGVAILMHMISAGIKGYYIFMQGKHCGGIGAKWLYNNNHNLLREFVRAISFDQRGTNSVITHLMTGDCCSNAFAQVLSNQLNGAQPAYRYAPDDTGIHSDTSEFIACIPECTNISVGYYDEHTNQELLDIKHLKRLSRAVLQVKWDTLPVDRTCDFAAVSAGHGETPSFQIARVRA